MSAELAITLVYRSALIQKGLTTVSAKKDTNSEETSTHAKVFIITHVHTVKIFFIVNL